MLTKATSSRLGIIFLAVLLFTSLLGIPALSVSSNHELTSGVAAASLQASHPAFTLTTSRTITSGDGQERLLSTQQRSQRSDGVYKLVQTLYAPDGNTDRVQTLFGFIGLGVFRLDEACKCLVFTGPKIDDRPENVEQFLRSNQLFTREESVAGISTNVWRKADRAEGDFVEEYRAASLGGLLVKRVKVSRRGREIVEPTSIELGEPASNLFNELQWLPVDYSSYEREVQETEINDPGTALLMQQSLDRMKQAKP